MTLLDFVRLTSFNREDAAINGNTPGDFRKSSTALSLIAGVNQAQRFALIGAVELFMPSEPYCKEYTEYPRLLPVGPRDFALVDADDYEALSKLNWSCTNGYAVARDGSGGDVRTIYMHRHIMSAQLGQQVDHKNHNGLDNRKANMRLCTPSQNLANSRPARVRKLTPTASAFRGVTWNKSRRRWIATIGSAHNPKRYIGNYESQEEAAIAYNREALLKYGDFANLNILNPEGQTPSEQYGVDTGNIKCPRCNRALKDH